jgi:microcystin degradation protein MlrC
MARIAVAGFQHETNTFSPIPTTIEDFTSGGINTPVILKGGDILYFQSREMNNATSGFLRKAASFDWECVPLLWAESEPSAQMSAETFDKLMGMFEDEFRASAPFDGVFLDLHGAMIYGDHQDGETEILRCLRAIVGDVPIVTALDLHGNIAPESFALASAMIGYRTYPHIDIYETGERCAVMLAHLLTGEPVFKAFRQLPFLIPTSSQITFQEPLHSIYESLDALEVLSATVMLGFPPGDIECAGPSVFAYAETQSQADAAADGLTESLLQHEAEFVSRLTKMDDAIERAIDLSRNSDKPIILADVQDNPGGGSGSDSVWILEELIRRDAQDAALGLMFDPEAANLVHAAGEGKTLKIDLGGKMMPGHKPCRATFQVVKLLEGDIEGTGPMAKGMVINLGKMALLKVGGIFISVASVRIQAADQAVFTAFGLDPRRMKILVLKSFVHFRAAFEEIAGEIIEVEAPGAEFDDPAKVQYTHLRDGMRLGGKGPAYERSPR